MNRRMLGEQFATATRLYAEAVVALTCNQATMSPSEYYSFREIVKQAQVSSEAIARAFENMSSRISAWVWTRRNAPRLGLARKSLNSRHDISSAPIGSRMLRR